MTKLQQAIHNVARFPFDDLLLIRGVPQWISSRHTELIDAEYEERQEKLRLLQLLQDARSELGLFNEACDHPVGICYCETHRVLGELDAAIKKLKAQ
jgi:hypothetical protein